MTNDGDNEHHDDSGLSNRWASFWEYGLIVAGLAIVITFGTHSLSRNMQDSAARSAIDPGTTASIAAKKMPMADGSYGQVQNLRP